MGSPEDTSIPLFPMPRSATVPKATAEREPAPPPTARQLRTDRRRQQIFNGALVCFEKNSFHDTTLNDIAAASGVSSGLIYQYFTDKRDLLFQVIAEILDAYHRDITEAMAGVTDPLERLQRAGIAYYKVINKRVPATLVSYREQQSLDRQQLNTLKDKELQTNQLLIDCIRDCQAQGYVDESDPELVTYWIVSTAHAWGLKNWRLRKIASFEEYTRNTLHVLLNGMLTDKGRRHLESISLLDGRPL